MSEARTRLPVHERAHFGWGRTSSYDIINIMTEIIPAILTNDPEELVRLVHVFERMGVERVHLDICDGVFVPTRTIVGYEELRRLDTKLKFDVHLMVKDPEHLIDHWHDLPADRFIVHVEATEMLPMLAEHCHSHSQQFWAAKNPETALSALTGLTVPLDGAMFMTVHPGQQGRPFVLEVLEQVKQFKAERPELLVMVDGGITPQTAPQCAAAGANILVAGSYIVCALDQTKALEELRSSL